MLREQRLKLIFAGLALIALTAVGGRSYAQMRDVERWEREERRLERERERRIEGLEKAQSALQLNIEIRLTKIETQLSNGFWMLSGLFGVIGIYLVALIGRGAASWIHEWRASHKGGA